MNRRAWAALRLAGAVLIGGGVVVRLGTGPLLDGLRSVSAASLAAACAIALMTTGCCAWRWWLVARGLGVPLRFDAAVLAYYRSQFLNGALPGGLIGDVHRGVRHGRDAGDVGRGLRAVLWERSAGQLVQLCFVALALAVLPSPVRGPVRVALAIAGIVAAVLLATRPAAGSARLARLWRRITADLRCGVAAPAVWPGVVASSLAAFAGHLATFLIAARVVGTDESLPRLVPLAMFVLLAAAAPLNIAGWGPREGAAAWIFSAAGLGGAPGVAAAAAYGVLVTAASLPGAVVLAVQWLTECGQQPARARNSAIARRAAAATAGSSR